MGCGKGIITLSALWFLALGRDPEYLDAKLLPFVKSGGCIYACVPGMKKDYHDNLPEELLLSWKPEQLIYLRDIHYCTCKRSK